MQSAWREDDLNASIEAETLTAFPGMLSRDDHKARADRLYYADNYSGAMRSAERAGPDYVALEKARAAMRRRAGDANSLVNSVPAALRNDPSLILARAEARQRAGDSAGAAKIFLEAPRDPKLLVDPDEWWREARVMVRGLLDRGDPQTAYRLAAHVGTPEQENYKADQQFTAGWVALRFLRDPSTAAKHFKSIESFSIHPTTLSRGLYWLGRAQEAAGDRAGAKAAYERAAPYSTTYYGQLARARLGLKELAINRPLEPNAADRAQFGKLESVRALRLLHAAGEKDLAIPFYVDLSERLDQSSLLLLAAVAYEQRDPRGMVLVGKGAHARGILIDTIAFPIFGIPEHPKDEPAVERSVVYAIARQESQFNQAAVSTANAYGLMQVITPTAKAIATRIGVPFDASKAEGRSGLQRTAGRSRARSLCCERSMAPTFSPSPDTTQDPAVRANGSAAMATRAIRRSMRSTGSSASRFPRPATTFSVSWRICRSTAYCSATTPASALRRICPAGAAATTRLTIRHGRACPGHPRLPRRDRRRGCPRQARA